MRQGRYGPGGTSQMIVTVSANGTGSRVYRCERYWISDASPECESPYESYWSLESMRKVHVGEQEFLVCEKCFPQAVAEAILADGTRIPF